ncbi:hypothetical protein D3C73_1372820 [compost metagenome]
MTDQWRQDDPRGVIGQRQAEPALSQSGVEAWCGQQAVEAAQRVLQGLDEGLGACGQGHVAVLADQQRVVEMCAQLRQGMADCRLAAVQADGSAGHVFFAEQCMQGQQQVEVDLAQFIHGANGQGGFWGTSYQPNRCAHC